MSSRSKFEVSAMKYYPWESAYFISEAFLQLMREHL